MQTCRIRSCLLARPDITGHLTSSASVMWYDHHAAGIANGQKTTCAKKKMDRDAEASTPTDLRTVSSTARQSDGLCERVFHGLRHPDSQLMTADNPMRAASLFNANGLGSDAALLTTVSGDAHPRALRPGSVVLGRNTYFYVSRSLHAAKAPKAEGHRHQDDVGMTSHD